MKPQDIVTFIQAAERTKKVKRSGWVREKVNNSENIADHCFRLIALILVLSPALSIDSEKLIKMAVIHGVSEAGTNDVIVERGSQVDSEERLKKESQEQEIIKTIFSEYGEDYLKIFHELTEKKTREARVFRQLDKLEMAAQALEYEKDQGIQLDEFFENARLHIKEPMLNEVLQEIVRLRK
jgi:5'-deoxynucleotidase